MRTKIIIALFYLITLNSTEAQIWKKITGDKKPADTTQVEKKEKKSGGGFFQKVIAKVAKTAGNLSGGMSGMVAIVDNLNDVHVIASTGTNIYPKSLGLVFNDVIGGSWVDNGDFTMLSLSSKNGMQVFKYGGAIKVDNNDFKYATFGIYSACQTPTKANKKIVFEKNGSVEGSFEIPAPKNQIKLLSINGQKDNVSLDLTKDVVLEMTDFSTAKGSLVRVDIIYSVIGIRTLGLVAYVKPAAKVTIPFHAFRNIETTNKGISFNNSYISIGDQLLVKSVNNTGFFKSPIDVLTGSNDGKWINVTAKPEQSQGFKIENGSKKTDYMITAEKKNANYAMPLSMAKKVAVASFSIQGTTQFESTKDNRIQGTTTTKELQFPQIPDAWQDATLEELYQKLTKAYTEVTQVAIMPAATITQVPSYENAQRFFNEDVNEASNFLRAYKGLNPIKPLSSSSLILNGENALLAESNSDALLKVKLDLQLSWDSEALMTPYLTVSLDGASNGAFRSFTGNTKYFDITIKGKPYEIKKKVSITTDEYAKITQIDGFVSEFKKVLTELKAKEEGIPDYEVVWKLQK